LRGRSEAIMEAVMEAITEEERKAGRIGKAREVDGRRREAVPPHVPANCFGH